MTEERDSQLSAMFDNELPAAECELLARRLVRDEALRAQWSRFSTIGAALRAERGVALHDRVAWKVQSVIAQEPTYGQDTDSAARAVTPASSTSRQSRQRWARFAMPVAGASIAASVAAVSIFWLRDSQLDGEGLRASTAPTTITLAPEAGAPTTVAMNQPSAAATDPAARSNGEPNSYIVPPVNSSPGMAPPARLANYVVAHSEYSGPLSRRMALLGLVGADGDSTAAPDAAPAAEDNDAP